MAPDFNHHRSLTKTDSAFAYWFENFIIVSMVFLGASGRSFSRRNGASLKSSRVCVAGGSKENNSGKPAEKERHREKEQ